jgi:predicted nucleic acid-binding protein
MSAVSTFFDTNLLLYLLSGDEAKANRAEAELGGGGVTSVQVLNEFAAVASRKLKMSVAEIREAEEGIRAVCRVVPLTVEIHDRGLQIMDRYGLSVYDAMIVATALLAGCTAILSEDMQDGIRFDGLAEIRNPFR